MFGLLARLPPLLVFLIVGSFLFALDSWRNTPNSGESHIQISSARIEQLERQLERRYDRPPSQIELDAELRAYIDEELLYREALRLGLHQSDEVVRRRLAQTMAFIIESKADLDSPSDSDIQAWYDRARPGANALTRVDFQHIFFSFDRNKGDAEFEVSRALEKLRSSDIAVKDTGDPFLLGSQFRAQSLAKLASNFSQSFSDEIVELELGQWSGPINSSYGHHLVLVERRERAKEPDLEQQRDQLINSWRIQRRREVREQVLDRLRQEFDIEVDAKRPQPGGQL